MGAKYCPRKHASKKVWRLKEEDIEGCGKL